MTTHPLALFGRERPRRREPARSRPTKLGRVAVGLVCASVCAWTLISGSASALPRRARPPAPPANPPSVTVSVVPSSPKKWTLRVENTGTVPLRIVADPRLLQLEITPPESAVAEGQSPQPRGAQPPRTRGRAKALSKVTCALPADLRPSTDVGRPLAILPGKAYKEDFDPRFFCFGARDAAALVAGATITPKYGWTSRATARPSPPFAVAPIPSLPEAPGATSPSPGVDPAKMVAGAPFKLGPEAVDATSDTPAAPAVATTDVEPRLEARLSHRLDVADPNDLSGTVTITNVGARNVTLLFRPQTVGFEVAQPGGGTVSCPPTGGAPIRELLSTVAPRSSASLTVLLAASCPDTTFDLPGIYEVRPRIDTRSAAATFAGIQTFAGQVVGPASFVRVRGTSGDPHRPPPAAE